MSLKRSDLNHITETLIEQVFRNENIMFNCRNDEYMVFIDGEYADLIDVIASLHNLLYEAVTGEKYDYMWHWANKVGAWCNDNLFKVGEQDEES